MSRLIEKIGTLNMDAFEEALIVEAPLCVDSKGNLLPADVLANTLKATQVFEKFAKEFRKQLTRHLIDLGTDLKVPGTVRDYITVKERRGSETINAIKAGPILREWFTVEECDKFLSVLKGEMLKVLAKKTPEGDKAKMGETLMGLLKEAGAVTEGPPAFSVAVVTKACEEALAE